MTTLETKIESFKARIPMPPEVEDVVAAACAAFNVPPTGLFSETRTMRLCDARCAAMMILRKRNKMTLKAIGAIFDRDHGTVFHALNAFRRHMDTEPDFRQRAEVMEELLK
jgi:chromosomal replication initiator protein